MRALEKYDGDCQSVREYLRLSQIPSNTLQFILFLTIPCALICHLIPLLVTSYSSNVIHCIPLTSSYSQTFSLHFCNTHIIFLCTLMHSDTLQHIPPTFSTYSSSILPYSGTLHLIPLMFSSYFSKALIRFDTFIVVLQHSHHISCILIHSGTLHPSIPPTFSA